MEPRPHATFSTNGFHIVMDEGMSELSIHELSLLYELFRTGYESMLNVSSQPRFDGRISRIADDVCDVIGKLRDNVVCEIANRAPINVDEVEERGEVVVRHTLDCDSFRAAVAAAVAILAERWSH